MICPKIFVAGHNGMVGSALIRLLRQQDVKIITKEKSELNLENQKDVQTFFKNERIDQVYLAAAKGGGKAKNISNKNLIINSNNTARIQECHIFLGHFILEKVEDYMIIKNKKLG
jgi:GDP-L-fucose synthase